MQFLILIDILKRDINFFDFYGFIFIYLVFFIWEEEKENKERNDKQYNWLEILKIYLNF